MKRVTTEAKIPMQSIGPILCRGQDLSGEIYVPMASFESPIWPSTQRGANVSRLAGGIECSLIEASMTRSILVEASSAAKAVQAKHAILLDQIKLAEAAQSSSRFVQLQSVFIEILGCSLYIRLKFSTADAAGHNMATKAAEAALNYLLSKHSGLRYISISANTCTDKKVSAVNGLLGRGRAVVADIVIPAKICQKLLRSTPAKIAELNLKKNWQGSHLAGSLRSANAHYANILLAVYLATGQDAANIVEGSQGFTQAEVRGEDLYFAVNLPNIIVGTIGNGKDLDFVQKNLQAMHCQEVGMAKGYNSNRLALIIAATVLCGELSLLAAQTNPGELVDSHMRLERLKQDQSQDVKP